MECLADLNFRDVGGLPARGGAVRRGVVYRCEGPANFDAAHREALRAVGFRAICDLRSALEQAEAPNDWAAGIALLNFDIIADLRAQHDAAWAAMRDRVTVEGARRSMISNYRAMPDALMRHLPALAAVLSEGRTPILIHCTAGKDRTGVLIGLLLRLAGVDMANIVRDYELSVCFGQKPKNVKPIADRYEKVLGFAPDEAVMRAISGVDAAYLQAAFARVEEGWGSVEGYFAAAGVDQGRQGALVAALVEGSL